MLRHPHDLKRGRILPASVGIVYGLNRNQHFPFQINDLFDESLFRHLDTTFSYLEVLLSPRSTGIAFHSLWVQ